MPAYRAGDRVCRPKQYCGANNEDDIEESHSGTKTKHNKDTSDRRGREIYEKGAWLNDRPVIVNTGLAVMNAGLALT